MELTKEKKILNVFSIIEIIAGILNILISAFWFLFGGTALEHAGEIAQETTATLEQANQIGSLFVGEGITCLIIGVVHIILGFLMRKLIKDSTKYKLLRTMVCISMLLAAVGAVVCLFTKSYQLLASNLVSLLIDGYVFYLINKIKKEA